MRDVLATVAAPPTIGTAPLFTRIRPIESRLVMRELLAASPSSDSRPEPAEKVAVVAMGLILKFWSRVGLPTRTDSTNVFELITDRQGIARRLRE
jgi:hypothetical protein